MSTNKTMVWDCLHSASLRFSSPTFRRWAYVRHRVAKHARITPLVLNGVQIMNTQLLQQARVLDIDEQIELVEAIWDGIVSRGAAPSLTEAQKTELDRRLADYLTNPNDVVSWNDVKAAALAKIRQ